MFDIGWTELLVVGVVALIVVGPKDLPKMFRTLGQFTAKARNMAREFQRAMDDAADDTGVKDVARDLNKATSSKNMGLDELRDMKDPRKMASKFGQTGKQAKPRASEEKDPGREELEREMARLRAERGEARARAASAAAGDPSVMPPSKPAAPESGTETAPGSNESKST